MTTDELREYARANDLANRMIEPDFDLQMLSILNAGGYRQTDENMVQYPADDTERGVLERLRRYTEE